MSKKFTRRHWGREVVAFGKWTTSMVQSPDGNLSARRVILLSILVAYLGNFPQADQWGEWNAKILAVLMLALIFETLFEKIPIADVLDMVRAVSVSVATKGITKLGSVVTEVSTEKETVTTSGPAGAVPVTAYTADKWGAVEK